MSHTRRGGTIPASLTKFAIPSWGTILHPNKFLEEVA
jgi:hypothetical protein